MTIRLSASGYSNTAPLIWPFLYGSQHGRVELILDNAPARSAELLRDKRVDCALVPVIEYQRIPGVLLVPGVCVGAREKVRSVCLVTRGADLRDVRTVALDSSSRTSVALTRIIFREFLGFDPEYRTALPDLDAMLSTADCALLIGDPALAVPEWRAGAGRPERRKFDLVGLWRKFTGFGFIFAMWMLHPESSDGVGAIDFAAIRDEGLGHLDEIIANYRGEIELPEADFRRYLGENISYGVDESMESGMRLFFELAFRHGLTERNDAPRYAVSKRSDPGPSE